MLRKHPFNKMSTQQCNCGKPLKLNVVNRKPTAGHCYKCHLEREGAAGHQMQGKKGMPKAPTLKRCKVI